MADAVFNATEMERIRAESEATMNAQIGDMESTRSQYEGMAANLDAEASALEAAASAQDHIAATATMTVYYTDSDGDRHSRSVPDTARRAAASAQAAKLRGQASAKRAQSAALRAQAARLAGAISKLQGLVSESNAYMYNLIAMVQQSDLTHAQMMEQWNQETLAFNAKMQGIYESFSDSFPLVSSDVLSLSSGSTTTGYTTGWVKDGSINLLDNGKSILSAGVKPTDLLNGNYSTILQGSISGRASVWNAQGKAGQTFAGGNSIYAEGQINALTAYGSAQGKLTMSGLSASVQAELALLSAEGKAGFKSEYLNAEMTARGTLGSARANAGLDVGWGKNGVKVDAKAEAMLAAAEGEVKGKFNLFGIIEIGGSVNGYAGAIGGKASAGFDSASGEIKLGASAAVGVGAGFGISIKPTGILADILGLSGSKKAKEGASYSKRTETVNKEAAKTIDTKTPTITNKPRTITTTAEYGKGGITGGGVTRTTTTKSSLKDLFNDKDKTKSQTSQPGVAANITRSQTTTTTTPKNTYVNTVKQKITGTTTSNTDIRNKPREMDLDDRTVTTVSNKTQRQPVQ